VLRGKNKQESRGQLQQILDKITAILCSNEGQFEPFKRQAGLKHFSVKQFEKIYELLVIYLMKSIQWF
jgi:hypothetical protein